MTEPGGGVAHSRVGEELGRAVIALIRQEPFWGHLLSGINRRINEEATRISISTRNGRPTLTINPEFFLDELPSSEHRSATVKHVVLGALLNHRRRFQKATMDAQIFQMASDVVINQMMGEKWPTSPGTVTLESFDFPLPPDMTLEWYYTTLWEHRDEIPEELKPEPSFDEGDDEDSASQDGQEEAIAQHELAKAVRDAKDRSGEKFGELPEEIQIVVEGMVEDLRPSVDWRRVVRLFAASSRKTRIANTLRRPSKRYGTYPGIKVKRLHRLAVIIDTSGSVKEPAFQEFFTEVHAIWRQGSSVTVIEADDQVRSTWEYHGQGAQRSRGRGGTNFDPALQWLSDAVPRFDAAVYFTDGKANTPKVRPPCEVLWVLAHGGDEHTLSGQRLVKLSA